MAKKIKKNEGSFGSIPEIMGKKLEDDLVCWAKSFSYIQLVEKVISDLWADRWKIITSITSMVVLKFLQLIQNL